jgi:hypothetical protein
MSADLVIQLCSYLIGVPLEFLVIAALLRGAYKQFPFIFVYFSVLLVTTLLEIPAKVAAQMNPDDVAARQHFAHIYWADEVLTRVLVLAVVISLIDLAFTQMRSRRMVRVLLILGAVLFAGISFAVQYRVQMKFFGLWMTPWTRDMTFGSAILDLGLWTILISKRGDRRLLLISGALGMQFAGEAIGSAIQDLSIAKTVESLNLLGAVIIMLSDLAGLYIMWRAFRPSRKKPGQK